MEFTDQPLEPFGETFLDMSVPTQLSFKTPLVFRMVKELVKHECLPWTGSHRAELCFEEALTNAMTHGNHLDPSKKVRVMLFADAERWGALIQDEGNGYGPEDLPDPDDPEFLLREAGRGIILMDDYVDGLSFNRTQKRLRITRHRQTEPDEAEAMAAVEGEAAPSDQQGPLIASEKEGVVIIELCPARISDHNIDAIRDAVTEEIQDGMMMVLDLGRVEYISSVGLGALVSIYKRIRSRKGNLMIASLQAAVKEIFDSARLLKLFQVAPDRYAAIKEFKKLA